MSVDYKLLKNYSTSAKKTEYRAVIVENQKVGLRRIAKNIEGAMSLTSADIVGAVAGLCDEIVHNLQSGKSVHLPGLGHFLTLRKGRRVRRSAHTSLQAAQCQSSHGEVSSR